MTFKTATGSFDLVYLVSLSFLSACAFFTVSSCASVQHRISNAEFFAQKAGMTRQIINTGDFHLLSFSRAASVLSTEKLHIYLEGDGYAVTGAGRASSNPTPKNPVGLELASLDKNANVVYLTRPCQFESNTIDSQCSPKYWTTHKYAEKIIEQINGAISKLVAKYQSKEITLVGYSGGGTIAALIAARRHDVKQLITVAGNLDHAFHTQLFKITPLYASLNPPDYAKQLSTIKQIHFVGQKDTIIPKSIAMSYKKKINADSKNLIQIIQIKDTGHGCCWEKVWQDLLITYVY